MRAKLIIGLFFLFSLNALGQSVDDFKGAISPQVSLMNRYGDYPVDLSNGLVDVSIPLYTIQTTSLSLPLELKFHASGLRADEREGLFGIRWTLFGGGCVTRIVKGYCDGYYPFNSLVNSSDYRPDFNTLFGTTNTQYKSGATYNYIFTADHYFPNGSFKAAGEYRDTEYDIFSYTLPSGKSGKFIVQGSIGVPMPYEPMKIIVDNSSSNVTIIDENGITYRFGGKYTDGYDKGNGSVITSHLSTIISANKQDTILFNYVRPSISTRCYENSLVVLDNLHDNTSFETYTGESYAPDGIYKSPLYNMLGELLTDLSSNFKQQMNSTIEVVQTPYSVNSIQFRQGGGSIGQLVFSYLGNNNYPSYLNQMLVKDAQNNTVKKIEFVLKNNLSGKLKLLDKIDFLDPANANNKYSYVLNYYDSPTAPTCSDLSRSYDWWGYYSLNGGGLKNASVSINTPQNGGGSRFVNRQIIGGDKCSDENSMEIGMLKSIQYPTGGQTEFEYEGNRTPSGQLCGGLRIKRVKNKSEQGKIESKYYEYGNSMMPDYLYPPVNVYDNIFSEHEVDCFIIDNSLQIPGNYGEGRYIQRIFQGEFPGQYTDFHSNIVYYPDVTEHIENPSGSGDNAKTVYGYVVRMLNFSYYNTVGGYDFEGYHSSNNGGYKHGYVSPTDFWRISELTSKTIYKGTHKVKEYKYDYQIYRKGSIFDMPVYRYRNHRISIVPGYGSEQEKEVQLIYTDQLNQTFAFKHQEYTIGANKLVKETENSYGNNGTKSAIVKEFTYDPVYLLPVSESITNSNGDVIKTEKKYPFNISDWILDEMVSKNILTNVIQTSKYKNNNFVESVFLNYKPFPSTGNFNSYRPESVVEKIDGDGDLRIHSMTYDSRGNPQSMIKDENTKIVYLWSYNYQYPVAKIEGLTYDNVVNTLNSNLGNNYISTLAQNALPTAAQIASIRSGLASKNALITTYTYLPLVGMVTATDPRGVTINYTYDTFNRLLNIKNDDNKVLNEYKYHYYNQ